MPSHVERAATAAEAGARLLLDYTRRQKLALQIPQDRDPTDWFACNSPFHREIRIVDHCGTPIQLVSILTVDRDSPYVWHARIGFMQAHGPDADHHLPIRAWTEDLRQEALRDMRRLTRMPREVERYISGQRPAGRPKALHKFWELTPFERMLCGQVLVDHIRDPRKEPGDD